MLRGGYAADRGVADLGEGGPGGGDLLLGGTAWPRPAEHGAAGERGGEGLAETLVREAVDEGVDAGGAVAEQVDEGDGGSREGALGGRGVEGLPGVGHVDGQPAPKEEHHDHHQHPDDPLLGQQLGLRAVDACPLPLGAVLRAQGRQLHRALDGPGHLDVAAVTLVARGQELRGGPVLLT